MKHFTLFTICLLNSYLLFAQYHCGNSGTYSCSPPYTQFSSGAFKNDSIPCIVTGQNIDLDIPIRPVWVGQIYCCNDPTSMVILSVDSLPDGLCWSTCYVNDTFGTAQIGCIRLSGICTAPPGTYHIKFFVRYHIQNGTNNTSTGYYGYYGLLGLGQSHQQLLIRVTNSNLPCFPVARVGSDNPYFVPYCSPSSVTIQQITPLVCGQSAATLSATSDFQSYLWSTGATTQQINISAPGSYVVNAVDTLSACQLTDTIIIASPTGSVAIQQLTALDCGQPSAILSLTDTYLSYLWSTGDTTQQINISAPGNYFVNVVDTLSSACQFSDTINVAAPTGSVNIQGASAITCDQHGGVLTVNDDFFSYLWSTGETTKQINISTPGTYYVNVVDTLSTACQFSDTFDVSFSGTVAPQDICGVTVDSVTGKNMLIWNKNTPKLSRAFFRIEKEIGISQFTTLTDLPYDSLSFYLDTSSNPNVSSHRYQLLVLDSCGNISGSSGIHETVHLSENTGISGTVNLIWNRYLGTTYAQVNVLRQVNGGAWSNLSTLTGSAVSFSDLTPPTGNLNYQIEVLIDSTCTPSRSAFSLFSNQLNVNVTGIDNITGDDVVSVYPNPNDFGFWILECGSNYLGGSLEIFDANGRVVFESKIINPKSKIYPDVAKGVYLLRVSSSKGSVVRKLVRL